MRLRKLPIVGLNSNGVAFDLVGEPNNYQVIDGWLEVSPAIPQPLIFFNRSEFRVERDGTVTTLVRKRGMRITRDDII